MVIYGEKISMKRVFPEDQVTWQTKKKQHGTITRMSDDKHVNKQISGDRQKWENVVLH